VVSNPPFNMDFSDSRDTLAGEKYQSRFFAGVPNVPPKDIDKMAIYLMFVQHIIKSLDDKGKAAIVVPTGFLTSSSGIQKAIKEYLVSPHNMLRGVISMPSNIFATTGTNVSILFLEKDRADNKVVLMDASKLGEKVKEDGKNQRTVLQAGEINQITSTFNNGEAVDDFSVIVTTDEIKARKLSFSASQYFEVKVEYEGLTEAQFTERIDDFTVRFAELLDVNARLGKVIVENLEKLRYG
jgi:type I restriction enzyme M protein